jgi:hypothetical protein
MSANFEDKFNARFTTKSRVQRIDLTHADPLQEPDTRNVSLVCYGLHSGCGGVFKNEANRAAQRFRSQANALPFTAQANSDLRLTFIVRDMYSNVANQHVSAEIRDSDLTPMAWLE